MKRAVEPSTHSYERCINTYSVQTFTIVYATIVVHSELEDCCSIQEKAFSQNNIES